MHDPECIYSTFSSPCVCFVGVNEFFKEYHEQGISERRLEEYAKYDTFNNVYKKRFKKYLRCMRCKGNHSTCDVSVIAIHITYYRVKSVFVRCA